jgi:signal transduction histidine kinase
VIGRRSTLVAQVVFAAIAVAVVVGAMFLVFLFAISSLRRSTARESQSKDVTVATLRLETLAADLETGIRGYVLTRNRAFLTPYIDARSRWPLAAERVRRLVAEDSVQRARVRRVTLLVDAYVRDYAEPVLAIVKVAPNTARSEAATNERRRRLEEIRAEFGRILTTEAARSRHRSAEARGIARRAELLGGFGLAVSVVAVLLFGAWVARAVARPVRRAADAAAAVAGGDFDVRLRERGVDEIAALAAAFNAMTRALAAGRRTLIEQNEQLQSSERHKSDLISMVSHELRTPLSSVIGFTRLLLDRDFDADERRRYLEIIDAEARRLGSLAEDFLDVRLLEEGQFDLELEPVDLVTLVREQVLLFFGVSNGHRLVLDLPAATVVVHGDRDRLAQVIGNLFSNAIKYSPEGGTVEVRLRLEPTSARLSVTDEGVGIPREHQERIFEKFFRGGAQSAGISGTGLGLAVSREIVDAHGGDIGFRSTEGVGSTFWLRLPLSRREQDRAGGREPGEASEAPAQRSMRR